jgi:hypothetical protein
LDIDFGVVSAERRRLKTAGDPVQSICLIHGWDED